LDWLGLVRLPAFHRLLAYLVGVPAFRPALPVKRR